MRFFFILMAVALAAGCASQKSAAPAPPAGVNLSGYPVEFRQGYADGCASAKSDAARTRDEARFKSDANYRTGWRDGFSICKPG